MKILRLGHVSKSTGSALLLALLVLLILLAIMAQLVFGTKSDADVARNDITMTTMDLAIESALMEVFDRLKQDGESGGSDSPSSGASGASGTGGLGDPNAAGTNNGATPGGASQAGGGQQSVDSREDSWGRPQRTTINDIELRVMVQDEDSKLNVLSMLTANEQEADRAFERLIRIIDMCREGTSADIDATDARVMAEALRDHLKQRDQSVLPRAHLLSDDDKTKELGLPISLKEVTVLRPFDESVFRDFRDERGRVVHSLGSFITTWTSLAGAAAPQSGANGSPNGQPTSNTPGSQPASGTGQSGASPSSSAQSSGSSTSTDPNAQGGSNPASNDGSNSPTNPAAGGGNTNNASAKYGVAVNVNTAPPAVLKALFDDSDIPSRFWDKVIEYRNLEEDDPSKQTSSSTPSSSSSTSSSDSSSTKTPVYDENGDEVIQRRVFDSLDELSKVDGYESLTAKARAELQQMLMTSSQVFSIYVTARKATSQDEQSLDARRPKEREDMQGNQLTRTVRCVVWRRKQGDTVTIVPLVRWEVLDYVPLEIQDYPDEDR